MSINSVLRFKLENVTVPVDIFIGLLVDFAFGAFFDLLRGVPRRGS